MEGLLALDWSEAFKLAKRSEEPAMRVPFRGGVMGTGATISLGMLKGGMYVVYEAVRVKVT